MRAHSPPLRPSRPPRAPLYRGGAFALCALTCLYGAVAWAEGPKDPTSPVAQVGTRAAPLGEPEQAIVVPPANAAADTAQGGEAAEPPLPPELADDPLLRPDPLLEGAQDGVGDMIAQLLKMLVMLGVTLAVVYLVLNKGLGGLVARTQKGKRVQVVERIPLEQRRSLYLVKFDGEEMLIGSSEGGIRVLKESPSAADESKTPIRYTRDFDGALSAHAEAAPLVGAAEVQHPRVAPNETSTKPLETTKKG